MSEEEYCPHGLCIGDTDCMYCYPISCLICDSGTLGLAHKGMRCRICKIPHEYVDDEWRISKEEVENV